MAVLAEVDVDAMADAMTAATTAEIPFYAEVRDADRIAQMRGHCREHARCVLAVMRRGSPPTAGELGFVRELVTLRARQMVPLATLLHAYRVGYRVTWDTIAAAAASHRVDREILAHLGELALAYFEAISAACTQAYSAHRERTTVAAAAAREQLLAHLLAGEPSDDGELALRLAAFGLSANRGAQVFVVWPGRDAVALEAVAETVARGLSSEGGPALVVPRHGHLVGVVALHQRDGAAGLDATIASAVRVALESTGARAGIGAPCRVLSEIPRGFEEARRALAHATAERPVCALAQVSLFDEVVQQADALTRRRIPAWVDALIAEDGNGGELLATLRVFLQHGQSPARAAEVLGVHVNTVRYRLQRLGTLSGHDLADFGALVEVVTALRLRELHCV